MKDMVNHPDHYKSETGLEAIDVIEAFTFDLNGAEATNTGNVLKYMLRWKKKNGLEDLKKARWYLNRLINRVELLEKENEPVGDGMITMEEAIKNVNNILRGTFRGKIDCPTCGQELIPLEPFDNIGEYNYWCDKCNLDFKIFNNNEKENEK